MLSDIDKRIEQWLNQEKTDKINDSSKWEDVNLDDNPKEDAEKKNIFADLKTYKRSRHISGGSVRAMAAVCTQIALENVCCSHYALRVMSRLVESLKNEDEKWDIRDKVFGKLCNQPNSTYNQLWLQNITYQRDKKNGTFRIQCVYVKWQLARKE